MHKGIPGEKRNKNWHKHHEKTLAKAKKRRLAGYDSTKIDISRAESHYKKAKETERSRPKTSRLLRFWLSFISFRPVVWIRKIKYWYFEKKYQG